MVSLVKYMSDLKIIGCLSSRLIYVGFSKRSFNQSIPLASSKSVNVKDNCLKLEPVCNISCSHFIHLSNALLYSSAGKVFCE